ncbi:MAG: hypothetical protein P8J59_10380 [Phycisphaerales bacterium]|nr:hypothetical protein [Phycisphaerales bacterium]
MKYPSEIRHTCGILHHLLRQATSVSRECDAFQEVIDAGVLRTDDRVRACFLDLVRARFGRRLDDEFRDHMGIADCARRIQVLPQVESPLSRQVIRQGCPGCGRVLLFPGMHGSIAAFHRLAGIMPESMEVVGWDHLGLDERAGIPRKMEDIVAPISQAEIQNGLDLEAPVYVFGFCVGGALGQAVLHQLAPRNGRLVLLDAHPAEAVAFYPRWRRSLAIAKAWKVAIPGGAVERRLVRIGACQLHALARHRTRPIDADLTLFRSGAPLSFGPLAKEHWNPHVRRVKEIMLSDLGHADLFRFGQEQRITQAFSAA